MVDLGKYEFKDLNTRKITPEEQFKNAYNKELYESEHFQNTNKLLRVILYAKYKKDGFT